MKKITKGIFLLFTSIVPSVASSCANNEGFYVANFENFMSPNLLSNLENNKYSSTLNLNNTETEIGINNVSFRTFSTNEDLERNFHTNYDVAIPTAYLVAKWANRGQLSLIDWSKFNLYKLNKYGNRTNEKIQTATDALTLFTPQARSILLSYDLSEAYARDNIDSNNNYGGLLNYCVPYFLQDTKYAYKSKDNANLFPNSSYTWTQFLPELKNKINNRDVTKIASQNDFRFLYSMSRLSETDGATVNQTIETNQLKTFNENINRSEYEKSYINFVENLPKNTFYLNTDSNNVLNEFASLTGSDSILSYNGDILYSAQGGDNYAYDEENPSAFKNWISHFIQQDDITIKVVQTTSSLYLLDCMVINKSKVSNNQEKENKAYALIKKIALEGLDQSLYQADDKSQYNNSNNSSSHPIFSQGEDEYLYGPMENFSYVLYTPPSLTLNAYVLNSASSFSTYNTESYTGVENAGMSNSSNLSSISDTLSESLKGNGFFTNIYNKSSMMSSNIFTNDQQYNNYINLLISIYQLTKKISVNEIQTNISDLNKSNMGWAFLDVQSKYF
ncbi:hypothetical protein D8X55_01130 [Malacoplasma penetrans]|uniref:Lipoprotein n=1 Tax=Malacoplasma penetrans (strain HF-2) TaxID=272633 RepID=Q8EUR0_MALP2|nr:lipoprotein [Malacoplasma penetrans]RXY97065.1 hypothetical protein D8X55_01130 [Malacoplasma penetrans]BAC44652.1 putative lipoprotein [Malacoplasma penetrans HF-2]